jgi:serine-type D-Ala-D-Ala carboxypeptidase/endopeptidase (penicillin-binding protein 4)
MKPFLIFLTLTAEAIEKLLCLIKSMILAPILKASRLAWDVQTKPCPGGQGRRRGENWRQKGDFMRRTSFAIASVYLQAAPLPDPIQKMMDQPKYEHSIFGLYVKDLQTGEVLFDLNSGKLFAPASTTKLFSVLALLEAYGDDYRFCTPVYAVGEIQSGILQGNLVLVGQGDLTLGGRQKGESIEFTKLDHIIANNVPGTILTPEDPLKGLNDLARQVAEKGIKEIKGDVIIDDSLFETAKLREMTLSPVLLNENLIDFVINPTTIGKPADVTIRPNVPGYSMTSRILTADEGADIEVTEDPRHGIQLKGTIGMDQKDVVKTFAVQDPAVFVKSAFIAALKAQGIKLSPSTKGSSNYQGLQPIAVWVSPPLSEYAKLIFKVSHNLGADLVPLLLGVKQGKKTFEEGLRLLGDFVINDLKISEDDFVFLDAAGGNDNRLTPQAVVQLLEYVYHQSKVDFKKFRSAMPLLGVDGSLEDFGRQTEAKGKVWAKSGTGMLYNAATGKFFLTTQALAGYIEGKNGHLLAYMVVVNNAKMPAIEDIFAIFEDEAQISNVIYGEMNEK